MTQHQRGRTDSPEARRQAEHLDELLDEAGQESFPASDPPAVTPRRKPAAPTGDRAQRDRRSRHERDAG